MEIPPTSGNRRPTKLSAAECRQHLVVGKLFAYPGDDAEVALIQHQLTRAAAELQGLGEFDSCPWLARIMRPDLQAIVVDVVELCYEHVLHAHRISEQQHQGMEEFFTDNRRQTRGDVSNNVVELRLHGVCRDTCLSPISDRSNRPCAPLQLDHGHRICGRRTRTCWRCMQRANAISARKRHAIPTKDSSPISSRTCFPARGGFHPDSAPAQRSGAPALYLLAQAYCRSIDA